MGTGETPKAAGDFLLDFDHADITFGQIIVERRSEIGDEGEQMSATVAQAVKQIGRGRVFRTTGGSPRWSGSDFILRVVENDIKTMG